MALSNEDKKDVSHAFGKKAAGAVSNATRDYSHIDHISGGMFSKNKAKSDAKNKALHAKSGGKYSGTIRTHDDASGHTKEEKSTWGSSKKFNFVKGRPYKHME